MKRIKQKLLALGLLVVLVVSSLLPISVSAIGGGTEWTLQTTPESSWASVCYGNETYVAVGGTQLGTTNGAMTSPDGVTWTLQTTPEIPAGRTWNSVCFGNNQFVAVSGSISGSYVMTSPDGVTWTLRTLSTNTSSISWSSVCYGFQPNSQGIFVAVSSLPNGTTNKIMYSYNGNQWTAINSIPVDAQWQSVCYGNGLFVAVASNGQVITSTNGTAWQAQISAANNYWTSVCYGDGLFVAVSSNGSGNRVMASTDGITWQTVSTTGLDYLWQSVCYGNGLFVAVSGNTQAIMVSDDGFNWSLYLAPAQNYWRSVYYGDMLFVACGTQGLNRVMTSPADLSITFQVIYDVNGGNLGTQPPNATGIEVGEHHTLDTTTIPTHAETLLDGTLTPVLFAGWSLTQVTILEGTDTLPSIVTSVAIPEANVTVYAVWGYDTTGSGIPDVIENQGNAGVGIGGGMVLLFFLPLAFASYVYKGDDRDTKIFFAFISLMGVMVGSIGAIAFCIPFILNIMPSALAFTGLAPVLNILVSVMAVIAIIVGVNNLINTMRIEDDV